MVKSYLVVQFKRLIRVLPMAVLFNFIAMAGICTIFLLAYNLNKDDGKISVGIVGDVENRYMKLGVGMLNSASKFSVKFESMDEADAIKAVREGEIIGYFRIDREFIEGLEQGENRPVAYISSATGGLVSELSREVASVFAVLIVNSEKVIYAVDDYLSDHPGIYDRGSANFELNMELINTVISREKIYKQKNINSRKEIPEIIGVMSGILILLMMFNGVGISGLLSGNKNTLLKLLKSKGVGDIASLLCELMAAFISTMFFASVFIAIIIIGKSFLDYFISVDLFRLLAAVTVVSLMFSAMHLFIYELIKSRVAAVLIEILTGISLGYIGGSIYPVKFFPELMQKISNFLPSGAGVKMIIGAMGYNVGAMPLFIVIIYTALFIGGGYILRYEK